MADRTLGRADASGVKNVLVSVVIPVFDDGGPLRSCVRALAAQITPLETVEIIVVDNGPTDGAYARRAELDEILNGLPAVVLHEPRQGSYAARNLGVTAAAGAVIAFTDADCLPAADWLSSGLEYLQTHPTVLAIAGRIELFAGSEDSRSGSELYEIMHGFPQQRYVELLGFGATANLFARREAFELFGKFDAGLRSGGDAEWGARLRSNGVRMGYVDTAMVRHPARSSWPALRTKTRRVSAGIMNLRRRTDRSSLETIRYALRPLRPPIATVLRAWRDPRLRTHREFLLYTSTLLRVRLATTSARTSALYSSTHSKRP